MKKLIFAGILFAGIANADPVQYGQSCSYGAPISAVYQQADGTWVIQVYGGINTVGGSDLVVNHSQLVFKGIKGTKSLADFKLGWQVEDKGYAGFGNDKGQCDYTEQFLTSIGLNANQVYIVKK